MEKSLEEYLKKHSIEYKEHKHKAVFTVEESKKIKQNTGKHTKCLFLKDNKSKYYLVAIEAEKRLDTKSLKEKLKVKKLNFASPEELKRQLNLSPGSVSIFGLIYSENITLIIDKKIWEAKSVGFHPNINTATLELKHESLEKFLKTISSEILVLEL